MQGLGVGLGMRRFKLVFVGAYIKSSTAQLQVRWLGRGHVQLSPLLAIEASHLLYADFAVFFLFFVCEGIMSSRHPPHLS